MVYGARLESVLGSRPHEFESRILRQQGVLGFQNPFLLLTSTTSLGLTMVKPAKIDVASSFPKTAIRGIRCLHISA